MKLEIKHIAPYLPYRLKVDYNAGMHYGQSEISGADLEGVKIKGLEMWFVYQYVKPILRPLSDLTKEIEHNGKKFVPIEKMGLTKFYPYPKQDIEDLQRWPILCEYCRVEFLFMWHFDVFGLIEQGLAVSTNDVKQ